MLDGFCTVKNWFLKKVEVPFTYIGKYPREINIIFNAGAGMMTGQAVWVIGQLYLSGNNTIIAQIDGANVTLSNLSSIWITGLISDLLIHGGQMFVTDESNTYITLALAVASFIRAVSIFKDPWDEKTFSGLTKNILHLITHSQNVVYDLKTLDAAAIREGEIIDEEALL
jgi:hypothetical protein